MSDSCSQGLGLPVYGAIVAVLITAFLLLFPVAMGTINPSKLELCELAASFVLASGVQAIVVGGAGALALQREQNARVVIGVMAVALVAIWLVEALSWTVLAALAAGSCR
jgi:hypothetical protein